MIIPAMKLGFWLGDMASDLFIVIATAGRTELLCRTLASLAESRKPAIYRETIVVENGPNAAAEEVVRSFHSRLGTRYVYLPQENKSYALNTVLGILGKCLIFFTDDDVRIHPNTLCAYAEGATGIEMGKFYGGPVSIDYEREPPNWLINYLPASARGWQLTSGSELTAGDGFFLGCNWAAFSTDLRDGGGFDVHRGPGAVTGSVGQEEQMQRQLIRKGVQSVYVPEAIVWHYVPAERCSPKWAAVRAYRSGISKGLEYTTPVPTILGFPRWMIRGWVERAFQVLIKSVGRDKAAQFDAYHQFCSFWGYMQGSRIARRNCIGRVYELR